MTPIIGSIKLKDLRAPHIAATYRKLAENLSDHSVRQTHAVLRKALKDAVKEGSLLDDPIDRLISTPTAKSREMESLTHAERERLLALNDDWTPLLTVLSITGLRIGEALALRWSDVELNNADSATLMVKRTLGRVPLAPPGQRLQFKEPKTDMSRRTIPLMQRVVTALRVQKLQAKINPDDLLFPGEMGGKLDQKVVWNAVKRSLRKIESNIAAGDLLARRRWGHLVKTLRVHDLRHTAGSIMHQNGVSAKEIQKIMGHSNIQTTLDIYVHTNEEKLRDAMRLAEASSMPDKGIVV
jgi:integrase